MVAGRRNPAHVWRTQLREEDELVVMGERSMRRCGPVALLARRGREWRQQPRQLTGGPPGASGSLRLMCALLLVSPTTRTACALRRFASFMLWVCLFGFMVGAMVVCRGSNGVGFGSV